MLKREKEVYLIDVSIWERDWVGHRKYLRPKDYAWVAGLVLHCDGSATVHHYAGSSHDKSARKTNWGYTDGQIVERDVFEDRLEDRRSVSRTKRRALLIEELKTDWHRSMSGTWTDEECAEIQSARIAKFRRARPTVQDAMTFAASVSLPDDLVAKWAPRFDAESKRLAEIEAERVAAEQRAAAQRKTWDHLASRARQGETITFSNANIPVTTLSRPSGMPDRLWRHLITSEEYMAYHNAKRAQEMRERREQNARIKAEQDARNRQFAFFGSLVERIRAGGTVTSDEAGIAMGPTRPQNLPRLIWKHLQERAAA